MKRLFYKLCFKLERFLDDERVNQLKARLKYCGANVYIHPSVHILGTDAVEIGENTTIASFTTFYGKFGVKIGKNCLISSNCGISSYNHIQKSHQRPLDTGNDEAFSKPVILRDNVWIGMNVSILPGVVIEENSIIGSGSVVTKNVPANEIWAGNPARFIKKIDFAEQGVLAYV